MKRGRPKSKEPKNKKLEVRLSQDELDSIDLYALLLDKSKSEMIRAAIEFVYLHHWDDFRRFIK